MRSEGGILKRLGLKRQPRLSFEKSCRPLHAQKSHSPVNSMHMASLLFACF